MSSSDEDECNEIFDAFDVVEEENVLTAEIASENIKEHGEKCDPYANKMTPLEADNAILKELRARHK